jgi:nitrogen fixation/metabolism regulation signal transduction histidine kinase
MTQQLGDATKAAESNRARVEAARGYLETILSHLSSGVMALNKRGELRTFNQAACSILGVPLGGYVGSKLDKINDKHGRLENFLLTVAMNSLHDSVQTTGHKDDVQTQVELVNAHGKQILTLRGTRLPDGGYVAVFDDATNMVQAQRDAAWGEVARRLAHEIKNPLTPIQLSAERLSHKLLKKLDVKDAEMLKRSTETIVNQVDAMKKMVNEFSEYARSPAPQLQKLDVNSLIREVVSFYDQPNTKVSMELESQPCLIQGDSTMLRQVIHNLLQNAQDALVNQVNSEIQVTTQVKDEMLLLTVQDNGSGFPEEMMLHAFEPYMTTKSHGTGLGLAIVKKIIEEHKGSIKIENLSPSGDVEKTGAVVIIQIPILVDSHSAKKS